MPFMCIFFPLERESTNGLLTFWKNDMSGKNMVPELWPKNLSTNQNARLFKLQKFTCKLRYKVD